MLIRYRKSEKGGPEAKALVYTKAEHRIEPSNLDPEAVRIVERLKEHGHETYIVGGAVRDLLLGLKPKDFDIVTDAQPARVRRIFRNSRVIGRRFRLVHVYAASRIYEVSTFRSIAKGTVGNEYGSVDEDALRRDFTLNALYYDPTDQTLVDYVGGFKHIAAKKIEPVIPLDVIFKEDPVRMIRCLKYAAITGFHFSWRLSRVLRRDARTLSEIGPSRLTEEFLKILGTGCSVAIVRSLSHYKLLRQMLPGAAGLVESEGSSSKAMYAALARIDALASSPAEGKALSARIALYLEPFFETRPDLLSDSPSAFKEALEAARGFLAPLNLPRVELEAALLELFSRKGIAPSRRARGEERRGPRPRGSRPAR